MDQTPKRREEYRAKRSSLNLTRNQSLAVPDMPNKPINWVKRLFAMLGVLVACFGVAYGAHMYFSIHSALSDAGGKNTATSTKILNKKPISILILGVDQGIEHRHDQGNSDTMILATANPDKNKSTMTSIPRDTLVDVKGDPGNKYFMFRVNSAYEVGGTNSATKTVSSLLNVPVDYYLVVNMKALQSLVDAVGGVNVKVPFTFDYDWCHFKKGKAYLDGRHAVAYVRMRKEDPRGDYGRQVRQRQIIEAVAQKAMSVNTIANYRKLVTIFNKYVDTNLTFGDMFSLALNYRGCAVNLKSTYVQGHDAWINGSSIQVASTKELQKKSDMIRRSLDLPTETLDNEETRQNRLNDINNNIKWDNPEAFTNYQIFNVHSDTPESSSSQESSSESSESTSSTQSSKSSGSWFSKIFK